MTMRSMTGYARVTVQSDIGTLVLELKSVNSRFLDLDLRVPQFLSAQELKIRAQLQQAIRRGKVTLNLNFQPAGNLAYQLNLELLQALSKASKQIESYLPSVHTEISSLLQWPGLLSSDNLDPESLHQLLQQGLDRVIPEFNASREHEGEKLKAVLHQHLSGLNAQLQIIGQALAQLTKTEWQRLRQRLQNLQIDSIEPERLAQEAAIMAQRSDIAEEYNRLRAHQDAFKQILEQGGSCGKRLDFLTQELNREANTIASKVNQLDLSNAAIELKVIIEQMREQIQNLE